MIVLDEYKQQIQEQLGTLREAEQSIKPDALKAELKELEDQMGAADFWNDVDAANKVNQRAKMLQAKINRFEKLVSMGDDLETLVEMAEEEDDESLVEDLKKELAAFSEKVQALKLELLLKGPYDSCDAVLSLHAGAGGTEAQDWTEMLYRMYNKWAVAHGMTVEVLDYQDGDEAGNDEQGRINEIFHAADAEGAAENGQHHPEAGADVNRYPEQGEMNHAREGKGRFPFCQARRMCMPRFGVGEAQRIVLNGFHEAVFHHSVLCRAGRPGV